MSWQVRLRLPTIEESDEDMSEDTLVRPERSVRGPGLATSALAALAGADAAQAEDRRRLAPETVALLRSSGFSRHFTPREHGGAQGNFAELVDAVATVGSACAATGWCASLAANLARMAAFLPAEGAAQVWAEGPDTLIVGSLAPVGKAEPIPGGWRVSGRWSYVSAVDFADWALLCAMDTSGEKPVARVFALPSTAYRIEDTWFTVGMRATGSNTLTVEDVEVPAALSFERAGLLAGTPVAVDADCYQVPLDAVNGLSFALPALGAAQGALAYWRSHVSEKLSAPAARNGMRGVNRSGYELALARSGAEIDAARLLLTRAATAADAGALISRDDVVRNWRDSALSVDMLITAVNRLVRSAGTAAQSTTNPLQRFWRDVNSCATHIGLQIEPAATAYAERMLAA
jgi:two-component flavin-dependent monooxygenase/oxygenase LndZ5